ncbi:MAG TPA: serine/threonine-protein kinase [Steroidobacteraceae bacterium]|nr:serine/threonine-protein kinase [Steroidobacteraceae bacterium]
MITDSARGRAYRIFSTALDLEPQLRAAHIQAECAGDAALVRHVLRLLTIATTDATATGALLQGTEAPFADRVGCEYGHFRLLECLGTGGMGAVYRAERTDGVPQTVAVKVLRAAISGQGSTRFVSEAKFLARLEHPAIARLIDVGIGDGEGWIAMELVRGVPITDYCDLHRLDLRARVRLLAVVIDAVAMAHRQLVVHRDIKPNNVLVTDDGHPKLIDFGIAAAVSEAGASAETSADGRLFTPHYAAPEQVRGEPVTVATDVFGLGALSYRVLSGVEPYREARSPLAYMLAVTGEEAEPPSRAALSAADPKRARGLRGDLDAMLLKALARDPARRYATAQELLGDCGRFLARLPVGARPGSVRYRLGKFVRRRALGVGVASLFALVLLVGGVIYGLQVRQVEQARNAAARRGEFLEKLLKSPDPREGRRDITVAELLDAAVATLPQSLGGEPLIEASMLGLIADTNGGLGRYREGLAASDRQLALLEAHGGSALETARALISRGELLRAQGRYADAVPVLRRALGLLAPLKGVDADRAAAFNELGMALANSGGEKEAEGVFRQAIELDRRLGPAQRAALGGPLDNLAVLLGNEGRYAESRDAAREALTVQREVLPATHPDLLSTEGTYAMTLLNVHDPKAAEPILRELITQSTKVRGPAHPDTLAAQVQLGEVLTDLQRFAEAEAVLRPTAETLDRVLGPQHRYATAAWNDLAIAACSGEAAAVGLAAAEHVALIRSKSLPADDWHQAASQAVIGLCLTRLHRYAEAQPVLLKAAASLEAARGADFYATQLAFKALQALYTGTGRTADAAQIAARIKD